MDDCKELDGEALRSCFGLSGRLAEFIEGLPDLVCGALVPRGDDAREDCADALGDVTADSLSKILRVGLPTGTRLLVLALAPCNCTEGCKVALAMDTARICSNF